MISDLDLYITTTKRNRATIETIARLLSEFSLAAVKEFELKGGRSNCELYVAHATKTSKQMKAAIAVADKVFGDFLDVLLCGETLRIRRLIRELFVKRKLV